MHRDYFVLGLTRAFRAPAVTLSSMAIGTESVAELCARAKRASHALATLDTATKNARARGDRRRARGARRRDPRGERRRPRGRPRRRARRRAARPAHARRGARRAMADGVRDIVGAARPGGRGARGAHPLQRARAAQGARPARSGRDRLRGAPERDGRRRGACDQVRQRGRAARLVDGAALERGAGARSSPRRARGPACPRARSRWSPGGGREELVELARQDGLVDL